MIRISLEVIVYIQLGVWVWAEIVRLTLPKTHAYWLGRIKADDLPR